MSSYYSEYIKQHVKPGLSSNPPITEGYQDKSNEISSKSLDKIPSENLDGIPEETLKEMTAELYNFLYPIIYVKKIFVNYLEISKKNIFRVIILIFLIYFIKH
jgi:hypothetical protein